MSQLEIKHLSIDKLTPYANNARVHNKKQLENLSRSIENFGFNVPILVDDKNMVISGNGRLEAAKLLKLDKVPVIFLKHLTAPQKKAFILADNKIAEQATWDNDLLQVEFESLQGMDIDFDLTLTGFQTPEIDLIMHHDESIPVEDPIDGAPQESLIEQCVSKGDLWQLGKHKLYCGDALNENDYNILMGKDKANLVFTDPPYNVQIDGHVCGSGKIKHKEFA